MEIVGSTRISRHPHSEHETESSVDSSSVRVWKQAFSQIDVLFKYFAEILGFPKFVWNLAMQLLGHTFMIPQRVALYCGDFSNRSEKKIWKKIGFITFAENVDGKQRELKTINLHELNVKG